MKNYATSWIDDRMPYQVVPSNMKADDFNAVRLGILRLGSPLSFNLDSVKGLKCVLDDHAWVFMDRFVENMPLLAWMNFESRSTLNKTIPCELRLYHFQASLLVDRSLESLKIAIALQLNQASPLTTKASVSQF